MNTTNLDQFPIGGVIAMGGNLVNNNKWLLCDGRVILRQDYPLLYAVIGKLYGGSDEAETFFLPDYRGYFLRGTDHGTNRDPNAKTRTKAAGSDHADAVGSTQEYATKRPTKPFTADVPRIPSSTVKCDSGAVYQRAGDGGAKTIPSCTHGGDGDTRPVNVYVAYYIKSIE